MRTGHLFAGAGGGLYADLILGHRPIFAVEWERYPAAVLQQRADEGWFPDLRVHNEDIRLFDPSEYAGRVDSLHAGFPCQDISVAGNGSGITGERSGLWSEVVRCADAIRPAELFLENSPAVTGRGLDRVLSDLAALGFDAEWCCLPAAAVGAPHRRDRWWCLARRADSDGMRELQPEGRQRNERRRAGDMGQHVADTMRNRGVRRRKGRICVEGNQQRSQEKRGTQVIEIERRCEAVADSDSDSGERLKSCQSDKEKWQESRNGSAGSCRNGIGWWAVEPPVGRVAHGVAHRQHQIKALGNGQVPLQAAMAYTILDARYAS